MYKRQPIIPSVRIGSPITLAGVDTVVFEGSNSTGITSSVDAFSDIMRIETSMEKNPAGESTMVIFKNFADGDDLKAFLSDDDGAFQRNDNGTIKMANGSPVYTYKPAVFQFLNYDVRSLGEAGRAGFMVGDNTIPLPNLNAEQDLVDITHVDATTFLSLIHI